MQYSFISSGIVCIWNNCHCSRAPIVAAWVGRFSRRCWWRFSRFLTCAFAINPTPSACYWLFIIFAPCHCWFSRRQKGEETEGLLSEQGHAKPLRLQQLDCHCVAPLWALVIAYWIYCLITSGLADDSREIGGQLIGILINIHWHCRRLAEVCPLWALFLVFSVIWQTNQRTNIGKNITSLTKVVKPLQHIGNIRAVWQHNMVQSYPLIHLTRKLHRPLSEMRNYVHKVQVVNMCCDRFLVIFCMLINCWARLI